MRKLLVLMLFVLMSAALVPGCGQDETSGRDPAAAENGLAGDLELVEVEELSAEEIFNRSMEAVLEANSYTYDMNVDMTIGVPGEDPMISRMKASGKSIKDPPADEMNISADMYGMQLDIHSYIVEGIAYMYIPEIGWVWQDTAEGDLFMDTQQDAFELVSLVGEVGTEKVSVEVVGDNYVLTFDDIDEEFTAVIRDYALGQLYGDPDTADMFGAIEFSNVFYKLLVDLNSFLPVEVTLSYLMEIDIVDDLMVMDQKSVFSFLEYGTVESIVVPDEVLDSAVAYSDLF